MTETLAVLRDATRPEHDARESALAELEARATARGRAARPLLATVSRTGRDGVAYVARLLDLALSELCGSPPRHVDLDPASTDGVSRTERARFAARLLALQALRRSDWALFNHVGIARAQLLVPRALRVPYAVFVHGVEVWGAPLGADAADCLRGAAVRISNSHFTARLLEEQRPDLGRVDACQLGLLPESADPAGRADESLLSRVGETSALIVGRMSASERYKGHDELIEAWPKVLESVPDGQLVVAGGGDDVERLSAKARAAGVGDRILFCGKVSDATLARLYERARMLAMPSRGEGFGIVYLEAMRAGRACLASSEDGAQDVVVDGETGVLVSRSDREALARGLTSVLADQKRAHRMGDAGRRRYESQFTFTHFRTRLERVLERAGLIERRGSA